MSTQICGSNKGIQGVFSLDPGRTAMSYDLWISIDRHGATFSQRRQLFTTRQRFTNYIDATCSVPLSLLQGGRSVWRVGHSEAESPQGGSVGRSSGT